MDELLKNVKITELLKNTKINHINIVDWDAIGIRMENGTIENVYEVFSSKEEFKDIISALLKEHKISEGNIYTRWFFEINEERIARFTLMQGYFDDEYKLRISLINLC